MRSVYISLWVSATSLISMSVSFMESHSKVTVRWWHGGRLPPIINSMVVFRTGISPILPMPLPLLRVPTTPLFCSQMERSVVLVTTKATAVVLGLHSPMSSTSMPLIAGAWHSLLTGGPWSGANASPIVSLPALPHLEAIQLISQ